MTGTGFPHSEISGSMPVSGSPELIAAYYVLRRLLMPRHPPCALHNLTTDLLSDQSAWLSVNLPSLFRLSKSNPGIRPGVSSDRVVENSELKGAATPATPEASTARLGGG